MGAAAAGLATPAGRRLVEGAIHLALLGAALASGLVTVAIVVALAREALTFFGEVPLGAFSFGTAWAPLTGSPEFGVLPLLGGSLLVAGIAMAVAVPCGLLAATWLSEYASPRARGVVKPALEVIVGVPTVVFGYFALTFFSPEVLRDALGIEVMTFNALSAGIVTGVSIVPVIATVGDDAMRAVPHALREGAFALGAARRHVAARIVAPAAVSGLVAAVSLGLAKAIGETMIVTMAAGSLAQLGVDPREGYATMTSFIANVGQGDASQGSIGYTSLFAVGAALFVITLAINVATVAAVRRLRREGAAA